MTNTKFTYEYILNSIKSTTENIDKTNAKLALVLSFSGVLINFGKDLPGYSTLIQCQEIKYHCITCSVFQFVSYSLIIFAIATSLFGLLPTSAGEIILPSQLITEEWRELEEEEYFMTLIPYLEEKTLLDLNRLGTKKSKRLTYSIDFVGGAVILLGLDKILGVSIPIFEQFCNQS